MSTSQVRVRFAPSPTGRLHIGGLRTALYNYLFARHHKGTFILRIEDTDQKRYVEEAEQDITESLQWAGLKYDEGPGTDGRYGPYRQSERSERYRTYAEQLVENGHAYYAFDTAEEIEAMRDKAGDANLKYDAQTRGRMLNSLTLSENEVKERIDRGDDYVIRLKVPHGENVQFTDIVRGPVSFETEMLDDQVLIKSDGLPTYHLANVVDDHEMEISHVIRGEEWLSSAPKHLLLYSYLGWTPPEMAHLPLIMSPAGGKLSKRKAEEQGIMVNTADYISHRYEPQALINFLAYLGWNPGDDRELMSLKELCDEFDLGRVSKSGAVFDIKKLTWYNEQYLRERTAPDLLPDVKAVLSQAGINLPEDEKLTGIIELLKERVSVVSEFAEQGAFFFSAPESYEEKALKKAWKEQTPELISSYKERILKLDDAGFNAAQLKKELETVIEEFGVGFGKLMLPLRVAVTGSGSGPDLFASMELIGKQEIIERLEYALNNAG